MDFREVSTRRQAPMEGQTERSHPWAHSNILPAREDLKSQISPWNSHRAFRDGRHITLEETHSPIQTTKALKIIRRVGPDSLAGFLHSSKSYGVVVADKSQATAALLMQRKEIHQGPVSICPGQNHVETWCCDTKCLTETWPWQWPLHGVREREATGNCALDRDFLGGNWGNHSTILVESSYSWMGFLTSHYFWPAFP